MVYIINIENCNYIQINLNIKMFCMDDIYSNGTFYTIMLNIHKINVIFICVTQIFSSVIMI